MKKKHLIVISLILIASFILISIGISYSLFNYQLKGKTKNKIVTGIYSSCEYENGTEWTFDYTGSEQTFTVPCDGEYKVELWGAQGKGTNGGYGSYTKGNIELLIDNNLYLYIGEVGIAANINRAYGTYGYNGGSGGNYTCYSYHNKGGAYNDYGGGATDIRLVKGNWNDFSSLKERIMVAAGGASEAQEESGAHGGGILGYSGKSGNGASNNASGGPNYGGLGYVGIPTYNDVCGNSESTGAGSGYYGGGANNKTGYNIGMYSAGSGSSFISGHLGCDAVAESSTENNIVHTNQPNHYSGYVFTDTKMIDGAGYNWTNEKGEYVGMPTHDGTTTMTGNSGNGYAKITLVKSSERYKESILNGTDPDLTDNLIPVQISGNGTVTKANIYDKWYSYENKEWANAVILKDESIIYQNGEEIPESNIESYFVWIPRYKYKIFDEGNYSSITQMESKEQIIEIVFENKDTTPSNGTTVGDYLTHPAFTSFDSNGMWVGKFETGYDGATTTAEAQINTVDTSKIIIKPNVYSWRNITVGNMFKNSYDYMRELDSHMMKNTEWGAVTYLQHSAYGSAISVRINNNSANITGYSSLTEPTLGYSTTSIEGNRYESTSIGVDGTYTVGYLNSNSQISSTTGNYTGIYDMSGGAWEYVMGYTTEATTDLSEITNLYSNFFSDSTYTKYWDKYISWTYTNYDYRILGDATGEMGPFGGETDPYGDIRYKSSWYKDNGEFAGHPYPWFMRGGAFNNGTTSGCFAFYNPNGIAIQTTGFRIALTP